MGRAVQWVMLHQCPVKLNNQLSLPESYSHDKYHVPLPCLIQCDFPMNFYNVTTNSKLHCNYQSKRLNVVELTVAIVIFQHFILIKLCRCD